RACPVGRAVRAGGQRRRHARPGGGDPPPARRPRPATRWGRVAGAPQPAPVVTTRRYRPGTRTTPERGGSVMARLLGLALGLGALAAALVRADEPRLPAARPAGKLELVATFTGPMPTGVTVSRSGRVFVNYPRWGDPVEFTVAEVKDGKATA